jgi:hypothetical protein
MAGEYKDTHPICPYGQCRCKIPGPPEQYFICSKHTNISGCVCDHCSRMSRSTDTCKRFYTVDDEKVEKILCKICHDKFKNCLTWQPCAYRGDCTAEVVEGSIFCNEHSHFELCYLCKNYVNARVWPDFGDRVFCGNCANKKYDLYDMHTLPDTSSELKDFIQQKISDRKYQEECKKKKKEKEANEEYSGDEESEPDNNLEIDDNEGDNSDDDDQNENDNEGDNSDDDDQNENDQNENDQNENDQNENDNEGDNSDDDSDYKDSDDENSNDSNKLNYKERDNIKRKSLFPDTIANRVRRRNEIHTEERQKNERFNIMNGDRSL